MVSGGNLEVITTNRKFVTRPPPPPPPSSSSAGYNTPPHPPRIVNAIAKNELQHAGFHPLHHQHHQQLHQVPQQQPQLHHRFSDGPLRPWPPMYKTAPGNYRSLIKQNSSHFHLNNNNLYNHNTMKNNAASAKYNKFLFNNAAAAGMMNMMSMNNNNSCNSMNNNNNNSNMINNSSSNINGLNKMSLAESGFKLNGGSDRHSPTFVAANMAKSKEQHLMQSYFRSQKNAGGGQYQKLGGGGGGSGRPTNNKENGFELQRMRAQPTGQAMTAAQNCACARSKSMEDIRGDVVVDWQPTGASKLNNANFNNAINRYYKNQLSGSSSLRQPSAAATLEHHQQLMAALNNRKYFTNANYLMATNGGGGGGGAAGNRSKLNMRRSMDNLLEIETNYDRNFQVYIIYWLIGFRNGERDGVVNGSR